MDFVSMPVKRLDYKDVCALPKPMHKKPIRGLRLARHLVAKLALKDLNKDNFSLSFKDNLNIIKYKESAIYLMNHSSAVDLEIFMKLFKNRMFYLVTTDDAYIGKYFIMRYVCATIPAKKYVMDLSLIDDIKYVSKKYRLPIVMFPEASWCLGSVQSILPESLGGMLKYFKMPVYNLQTFGAYQMCPQYNNAHNDQEKRKVNIHTEVEHLFSKEDLVKFSPDKINKMLKERYTYDHFRWQFNNHIKVDEPFRAKGLHHILYKCPHCKDEGQMSSQGITIKCENCGKEYELTEYGKLQALGFEGCFEFVSDWYYWQEQCVKDLIKANKYFAESKVRIYVARDYKTFYDIGDGHLKQDKRGLTITDMNGNIIYEHLHEKSYSLYVDFHFYGAGDIVSIGNTDMQYYCFTDYASFPVLKARYAAEEAYRLHKLGKD